MSYDHPVNRAYWAGLFDGEGSIALYPQPKCKLPLLRVRLTNTNMYVLELLKQNYGGSIASTGAYPIGKDGYKRQKCFRWQVTGDKALMFLEDIRDFVIIKYDNVRDCIKFQKERNN